MPGFLDTDRSARRITPWRDSEDARDGTLCEFSLPRRLSRLGSVRDYSPTVKVFDDSTAPSEDLASTFQGPVHSDMIALQLQVRKRDPLT